MAKGLYQTFKTDSAVEKEGIVLAYGPNSKGLPIEIRVARAGGSNTKFKRILELKTRPYKRQIAADSMPDEVDARIMAEVYAEAVILGWENVESAEGNPLPFSKENCIKLLSDLPELFRDIRDQTTKFSLFKESIQEDDSGN